MKPITLKELNEIEAKLKSSNMIHNYTRKTLEYLSEDFWAMVEELLPDCADTEEEEEIYEGNSSKVYDLVSKLFHEGH